MLERVAMVECKIYFFELMFDPYIKYVRKLLDPMPKGPTSRGRESLVNGGVPSSFKLS